MVLRGFGEWAGQGLLGLGVWMLVLGGLGCRDRWGGECGWDFWVLLLFFGKECWEEN